MALRLLEIVLPKEDGVGFLEDVDCDPRAGPWTQTLDDGLVCIRFVLEAEDTSAIVDEIQARFGEQEGFHLLLQPVTAALPKPPEDEDPVEEPKRTYGSKGGGLTREELTTEARAVSKPSRVFHATVVLSTIVVSIGLLRDNVAVIIGAMVIAPLLGPNVALALSTTLGDTDLMRRSLLSSLSGITIAFALSVAVGLVFSNFEPGREILSRTDVGAADIVLALAAGAAGALAMTTGVGTALVGVMVAVALLPPTAVVGIMLARGEQGAAGNALMLLGVNVICVNLAATLTFLAQGIRPRTWWEADRARRATIVALTIGVVLVAILGILLWLGGAAD